MSVSPPPLNISQLNARLEEVARAFEVPTARIRRMLCTLVVSQMLPDAVAIKGGMGIKLLLGEHGTRATADLDISTSARGEAFEHPFRERLARGWGTVPASRGALRRNPNAPNRVAFTATLRPHPTHDPGLARPQCVIHPYRVSLSFLGMGWAALDVEVSDPEIEPLLRVRREIDGELSRLNEHFGFGILEPVELVALEYQIAQKIHAVTDPGYVRAHDLVDLQLLWRSGPDLSAVREFCIRTFEFRRAQTWPPLPLRHMVGWEVAYQEARKETQAGGPSFVLADLESAREWLQHMITSINTA